MKKTIKDSCTNEFDPNALEEIQAINKIISTIKPIKSSEKVRIKNALHRTVASPIRASINVPSFENSAMDGYAFNLNDLKSNKFKLTEIGVSYAGKPFSSNLRNGETVRVETNGIRRFVSQSYDVYPGSVIYVPRDIGKVEGINLYATLAPIFSSLALSVASLNSISD